MSSFWGESGISVVLLPGGQQGDALLGLARSWTEAGLIGPAVWITPDLIKVQELAPPMQYGFVIARDGAGELETRKVDLFRLLAEHYVNVLRLVAVRPTSPSKHFDDQQSQLINLVSKYVSVTRPQLVHAKPGSSENSRFLKIGLITAPTEFVNSETRSMSVGQFNAVYVASPEDRTSPLAGDAFVRDLDDNRRFDGFTMMHLATVSGLWLGLPQSVYEFDKQEGWFQDQATIARVFVSGILTDGLARRASAHVLERAGDPVKGFIDFGSDVPIQGTFAIPESQIDDYIKSATALTFSFDDGSLQYKPVPPPVLPEPYRKGIFGFLGEFFRFSGSRILRIPLYAGMYLYRGIVRALNTIFQGGNKGLFIIEEPSDPTDRSDEALLQQRNDVFAEKEKADRAISSPFVPSQVRSTPVLWSSIRKLTFGLLDGSNLHDFGYQRSESGWPIFYRLSSLFHDPFDVLKISDSDGDREIKWSGLADASAELQKMSELLSSKQAALGTLKSEHQASFEALARVESALKNLESTDIAERPGV